MDGSFALVLNPFIFVGELPVPLSPDICLDRATSIQREIIASFITELGSVFGRKYLFLFEPIPPEKETLGRDDWRQEKPFGF